MDFRRRNYSYLFKNIHTLYEKCILKIGNINFEHLTDCIILHMKEIYMQNLSVEFWNFMDIKMYGKIEVKDLNFFPSYKVTYGRRNFHASFEQN